MTYLIEFKTGLPKELKLFGVTYIEYSHDTIVFFTKVSGVVYEYGIECISSFRKIS